jgi:hypothetical protein
LTRNSSARGRGDPPPKGEKMKRTARRTIILATLMMALMLSSGVALAVTKQCQAQADCFGTKRADILWGTDGPDSVYGRAGGDTLKGLGERDELYGQAGSDRIFGGPEHDYLVGGAGNDAMRGGGGED